MGHDHQHDTRSASARALVVALALTASYTVVEVVGGFLTDSLALLADAVHMLSDNVALALALFALWLAGRPSTPERTYGYKRAEVLAALANGVALVALAIWIFYEAIQRLSDPPDVLGGWMLAIAVAGIAVNVAAGVVLHRARGANLNVEAAFRHVLADLAGSVGVAVAALVIVLTRLARGGSAGQHRHRRARPRELVVDPPRLDVDPPRGRAERARHALSSGRHWRRTPEWSRCTTSTSGRSPPAFPPCPRTSSSAAARTVTGHGASSSASSPCEFGIEHTTLQVDHVGEQGGLVELGRF